MNEHSIGALQAATEEAFNCNPGLTMRAVAEALARSAAARAFAIGGQDNQLDLHHFGRLSAGLLLFLDLAH